MACPPGSAWLEGKLGRCSSMGLFTGQGQSHPQKNSTLINMSRTAGGNMIYVGNSDDFEMYSSTSQGAIQGYGYVFYAGMCREGIFISWKCLTYYSRKWWMSYPPLGKGDEFLGAWHCSCRWSVPRQKTYVGFYWQLHSSSIPPCYGHLWQWRNL